MLEMFGLDMFEFAFMQRAWIAGLILAVLSPLIGFFLVVRRYSLLADCLAHVSLAGVAVGLLTKINPVITALGVSTVTGLVIEKIRQKNKGFTDGLLALFLWAGLSGAVVLISIGDGFNVDLFSYLFGSISSVTAEDIYLIAFLGAGLVLLLLLNYHQLFLVSLDEELAQVSGLKPAFYNYLLILAASVTVAVSMRIVGVMLVGALMVVPVLSAMNFKRGFGETLFISVLFSLASVLLGLSFSYHFDIVSGGAIVLVSIGLYLISLSRVK